jgi:rubrerythrin
MSELNDLSPERFPCPEDYDELLKKLRIMAGREERDIELYDFLIDQVTAQPTLQQREPGMITNRSVLRTNRDITRRNLEILEETYRELSGERLVPIIQDFRIPVSYRAGLERAVMNELQDAEIYRDMILGVPEGMLTDIAFRLYSNTMMNIDRLNFLLTRTSL